MKNITLITLSTLAMSQVFGRPLPICPDGCDSGLSPVEFDECNPETNGAQIAKIYVTTVGSGLTDWNDPLEWQARLDNTAGAPDSILALSVIGSRPIPTSNPKEISGNRKITGVKTFTLPLKIDETNITNHEFVRQNECGGIYQIWYETLDGQLYGGTEGISNASLLLDLDIAESSDELTYYSGNFEWKSKFTEERTLSPIA